MHQGSLSSAAILESALPGRFASADPVALASTAGAGTRALFQRFDLQTRQLVRSVIPLRMDRLTGARLKTAIRESLGRGPLFLFAGLEALTRMGEDFDPAARLFRLSRYVTLDHYAGVARIFDADGTPLATMIDELDGLLRAAGEQQPERSAGPTPAAEWQADVSPQDYVARVAAIRREIESGRVEGVNLSVGLSRPTDADPFDVYRACAASNPSPYGFVLSDGDFALIGSSPLAFMQLEKGRIHLETDAGTRPVGADAAANDRSEIQLQRNPKDAAEHQVVVDAELQALAPIAAQGRVRTVVSRQVRRFSHVMHLYSAFEIELREGLDVVDAIEALAPAAAVSGHPKRAALAIARQLEGKPRGPYGGVIGLIASPADADLAVVIRSMWIDASHAHMRVGGKVVADSVAEIESAEALSKARFLVDALASAESKRRIA